MQESESPHYCPKLETLQEQLRRLEEENEQLREEVRLWQEHAAAGGGC